VLDDEHVTRSGSRADLPQPTRRNVLALRSLAACSGFLPAAALFVPYFADVSGSVAVGAATFSAGLLLAGLLDVPTGVFADRVGRRRAAVVGALAFGIGLAIYAASVNWQMLLVGAIFDGLGMALLSGNDDAFLYETLEDCGEEERFADELARLRSWQYGSTALSSLVGIVLVLVGDLRWTVWACVPTQALGVACALALRDPLHRNRSADVRAHLRSSWRTITADRSLRRLLVGATLGTGVGNVAFVMRPVFIQQLWPLWVVSAFRTAAGLFAAAGTRAGGRLVRRFGAVPTVVGGQTVTTAAALLSVAVPTVASPGVLSALSMFHGIRTTADGVVLQEHFTEGQRATLASTVTLGARIAFGAGATAFGLLVSWTGVRGGLLLFEASLVLTVPIYLSALWSATGARFEGGGSVTESV